MALDKILDRVRKLLALAGNAGTEAEAASANEQAAALIEQYQLTEALIALDQPAKPKEPIITGTLEDDKKSKSRVAWRETVAEAVGESLGIKVYYYTKPENGRNVTRAMAFGRESAVQAWSYMYQYMCREIEGLCESAWEDYKDSDHYSPNQHGKAWKSAFKIGASIRVAIRLREQTDVRRANRAEAIKEAMAGLGVQTGGEKALLVLEKDEDEVSTAYKEHSKNFGRALGRIGRPTSHSGYDAGCEAGNGISLGGAKGGLPAGQGRLTK